MRADAALDLLEVHQYGVTKAQMAESVAERLEQMSPASLVSLILTTAQLDLRALESADSMLVLDIRQALERAKWILSEFQK